MKKTKILFMMLIMVMLPLSTVRISAEPEDVPLEYENPSTIIIPTEPQSKSPKTALKTTTSISTLRVTATCCVLWMSLTMWSIHRHSCRSHFLGASFLGTYELQIIPGIYCFYGDITL